jgi:hypothetical protein
VVAEVKEHPSAAGGLLRRQRPGTGTDDAETSGKHEPFLRSSDSEIHTPLVHSEIDARDRTDAVNVKHRRVGGSIDRAPYRGDVARNTGGGLVVDYKNAFDCMRPVGPQGILNAIGRGPYPPLFVLYHDIKTDALREINPEVAELAEARR